MGQYHKLYNVDKKEYVCGHHIDNGLKLMEQVGFERCTASALWLLVANSKNLDLIGSWAEDSIVVQGDYAKPHDCGFITEAEIATYTDISDDVLKLLIAVFPDE